MSHDLVSQLPCSDGVKRHQRDLICVLDCRLWMLLLVLFGHGPCMPLSSGKPLRLQLALPSRLVLCAEYLSVQIAKDFGGKLMSSQHCRLANDLLHLVS